MSAPRDGRLSRGADILVCQPLPLLEQTLSSNPSGLPGWLEFSATRWPAPPPSLTMSFMDPTASDAELVQQTLRGVTDAFHQLTLRYYRPVGGFILKRVGRPDLVEDLVQETFLEAFQALKGGRGPQKFSTWLFGIAHNRCGKWLRRKRPTLFAPNEAPDLATTPSEQQLHEELEEQEKLLHHLQSHLRELPEETRKLLEMKHRDGKTCEEIAAATGKPVGTVKSLLARTYKSLRHALTPASGEASR
jgi:RNA polymerase sigma-70 factor (ECF subfamily)